MRPNSAGKNARGTSVPKVALPSLWHRIRSRHFVVGSRHQRSREVGGVVDDHPHIVSSGLLSQWSKPLGFVDCDDKVQHQSVDFAAWPALQQRRLDFLVFCIPVSPCPVHGLPTSQRPVLRNPAAKSFAYPITCTRDASPWPFGVTRERGCVDVEMAPPWPDENADEKLAVVQSLSSSKVLLPVPAKSHGGWGS